VPAHSTSPSARELRPILNGTQVARANIDGDRCVLPMLRGARNLVRLVRFATPGGLEPPYSLARPLVLEEAHRLEWCRAPANLEVQFRRVDIAGLARVRNYLPAPDPG
jgi:hypothetical protein